MQCFLGDCSILKKCRIWVCTTTDRSSPLHPPMNFSLWLLNKESYDSKLFMKWYLRRRWTEEVTSYTWKWTPCGSDCSSLTSMTSEEVTWTLSKLTFWVELLRKWDWDSLSITSQIFKTLHRSSLEESLTDTYCFITGNATHSVALALRKIGHVMWRRWSWNPSFFKDNWFSSFLNYWLY